MGAATIIFKNKTCTRRTVHAPSRRSFFWNAGWSSPVARQAHNLKVLGSNPSPATNFLEFMSLIPNYRVYVLQNPENKFYIGLSENPANRLLQHNSGVSQWTRNRGPWRLVWQSESMTLTDARKLENQLKRQKGGRGFYQLTGLVPSGS
jgi:putative endonuclease